METRKENFKYDKDEYLEKEFEQRNRLYLDTLGNDFSKENEYLNIISQFKPKHTQDCLQDNYEDKNIEEEYSVYSKEKKQIMNFVIILLCVLFEVNILLSQIYLPVKFIKTFYIIRNRFILRCFNNA